MAKRPTKTAKSKKRAAIRTRPVKPPTARTEAEIAALAAPGHVQRYVDDVLTRGEAGTLKNGKLPLGKTHVIENKKGAAPKLTRVRYTLAG